MSTASQEIWNIFYLTAPHQNSPNERLDNILGTIHLMFAAIFWLGQQHESAITQKTPDISLLSPSTF
ncbi:MULTISPECIES: hypothetical protein [Nostocales]|uniref:Transposase n=2 Tax=Nostocales TaxID=1161 RepID=A0ABW8X1F4_9CYAN